MSDLNNNNEDKYEIWKDKQAKLDFVMNCGLAITIIIMAIATFGILLIEL